MTDRSRRHSSDWDDDRILAALATLDDNLRVPDDPLEIELDTGPVRATRRRRALLVAAAIVVATTSVLASAPARDAVADWLGIGRTEVRVDPERGDPADSLPALADGALVVDADTAAAELGRPLPPVGRAGSGDAPEYAIPTEGGVLVRWSGHDETLWLLDSGGSASGYRQKLASSDRTIELIDDLGDGGLWIGEPHVLVTPGRAIAAAHVLLWVDDGIEFRLEGDAPRAEMVMIARNLR